MDLIDKFAERLCCNKSIFIHVIGDSMLDQDYLVNATRISPECPNVNILQSPDDKPFRQFPGGAANVCFQLSKFNAICRLFTFVDEEAHSILSKYIKYWSPILLPKNHRIPRKKRYYAQSRQVVNRCDVEQLNYGLECINQLQNQLLTNWSAFQAEPDAIILSDYNKGLFEDFELSKIQTNAITIVDSKAKPLERWKGCTIFKPNAKEAYELSGKSNWKDQCDYFKENLLCKAVIITQEGRGIVGKINDYFEYKSDNQITAVDIVGAGDCFAGILALAISLGFSIDQAAIIAFHGGQLCVQQKDRGSFGPWLFSKIVRNPLILKDRNYKLIFTNGIFDILHSSHIDLLKFAKSKGEKLIVAVNSDASTKRLKGETRPIIPLEERMKLLAALDCVDFVVSFTEDTPLNLVKTLIPDFIVKGGDYKAEEVAGSEVIGTDRIILYPYKDGNSTSSIIEKIKALP